LGAFIACTGTLSLITDVDHSSFSPAPKVESAFIKIDQKQKIDFELYPLFKAFFKDPNKTINNCLKQFPPYRDHLPKLKEQYPELIEKRARQLEATQLLTLAKALKELI
ncbi:MAG: rRNA adenine N-6-methyltransferase family protein, partial [Bacilli bacterium]